MGSSGGVLKGSYSADSDDRKAVWKAEKLFGKLESCLEKDSLNGD